MRGKLIKRYHTSRESLSFLLQCERYDMSCTMRHYFSAMAIAFGVIHSNSEMLAMYEDRLLCAQIVHL